MTDGSVLYRRHDSIATLTLNRPESLNAMNEPMMGEIERILIELEADTEVRAVVLTGAGRAFSSGGDQKRSGESPPSFFEGDLGGALIERLNRCVLRMQRLQKPIVGSINGVAAGAGLNIALATDLRIAADTARFGEVFARVGLVPDGGGTYFLPRLVGTAKAMEMILLADIIDAQEALRIGLVSRVVPAEQLEHETLKLAERLAQGPTVAYGLAKTGLYQGLGMSLEDVLNMEARNQAIAVRPAADHPFAEAARLNRAACSAAKAAKVRGGRPVVRATVSVTTAAKPSRRTVVNSIRTSTSQGGAPPETSCSRSASSSMSRYTTRRPVASDRMAATIAWDSASGPVIT